MAWDIAWLPKLDILDSLERWFDPTDPEQLVERYDEAIDALESSDPSAWLAVARKAGLEARMETHFREHWLGESDAAYWSSITSTDAIEKMRLGFTSAMRTAREQQLPINYIWVTPDGLAKDYFEVGHVAGARTVTAVIMTATPETLSAAE